MPEPADTVRHAEGCRRPAVVRTKTSSNGAATRWETRCSTCGRRTFEVVDADVVRQVAAGLVPGDSFPAERIPRAVPYHRRYWERRPRPTSDHEVRGF